MSPHATDPAPLILVLGGARSGKSDYALELAQRLAGDRPVLFVATAQAGDPEMAQRIQRHRQERPSHWQTLEAPTGVGPALTAQLARASAPEPGVILLDCLTLLVSNVLLAHPDPAEEGEAASWARLRQELDGLLEAHGQLGRPFILVSNEVGLGIVPGDPLSRLYRDLLGRTNRYLAQVADQALFLLAGIPLDLKALQARLP